MLYAPLVSSCSQTTASSLRASLLTETSRLSSQICHHWKSGRKTDRWNLIQENVRQKKNYLTRETSHIINTKTLQTSDISRYLGVSITDNLTWSRHTAITAGKANRVLGFLRRNINDCSTKSKAISYIIMVFPIMEHASTAGDPRLQKDTSQLQRLQRRAARF